MGSSDSQFEPPISEKKAADPEKAVLFDRTN